MTTDGWLTLVCMAVLLAISTPLLGNYMAKVYGSDGAPGDRFFLPVEHERGAPDERSQRQRRSERSSRMVGIYRICVPGRVLVIGPSARGALGVRCRCLMWPGGLRL
jgi:hypothetical protein